MVEVLLFADASLITTSTTSGSGDRGGVGSVDMMLWGANDDGSGESLPCEGPSIVDM